MLTEIENTKKKKKNSEACNFTKKEALSQVFSCEFCEISKNNFSTEHLQTTASGSHSGRISFRAILTWGQT